MPELIRPAWIKPGLHFDPTSFALDLYRLLCVFLADREVVKNFDLEESFSEIATLRSDHLSGELVRILITCSVALRLAFDQYPKIGHLQSKNCGKLYGSWSKQKRKKPEILTLREACNKIIHAKDCQFDASKTDPNREGIYLRPFLFLYGKKHKQGWRAKLSIAEFVKWGAVVFLRMAGR